jgi:hypothetical protein
MVMVYVIVASPDPALSFDISPARFGRKNVRVVSPNPKPHEDLRHMVGHSRSPDPKAWR